MIQNTSTKRQQNERTILKETPSNLLDYSSDSKLLDYRFPSRNYEVLPRVSEELLIL